MTVCDFFDSICLKMCLFPDFDVRTKPLVLIKEAKRIAILNLHTKELINVSDDENDMQLEAPILSFVDSYQEEVYSYITNQNGRLTMMTIDKGLVEQVLKS